MAESEGNGRRRSLRRSAAGPSTTVYHYCYQCERTVHPTTSALTCPVCHGGFVEELVGPGAEEAPTSAPESPAAPSTHVSGQASSQTGPREGNPRVHTVVFRMGGNRNSRPMEMVLDGDFTQRIPQIVSQLFSQFTPGGGAAMHSNPADYVWGPGGLDAIITQLLNNMEGAGPPPADRRTIVGLPTVRISQTQVENCLQCSVCFEDFKLKESVKVLPCQHHYHEECIVPWLEMHGTCPVCRKDLKGDDTSTQEFATELGDTLNSLNTSRQQGSSSHTRSRTDPGSSSSNNREHLDSNLFHPGQSHQDPTIHDEDVD